MLGNKMSLVVNPRKFYYFISYAWRYKSENEWQVSNKCIDIHPMDYIKELDHIYRENKIIFYQLIHENEYERYK